MTLFLTAVRHEVNNLESSVVVQAHLMNSRAFKNGKRKRISG